MYVSSSANRTSALRLGEKLIPVGVSCPVPGTATLCLPPRVALRNLYAGETSACPSREQHRGSRTQRQPITSEQAAVARCKKINPKTVATEIFFPAAAYSGKAGVFTVQMKEEWGENPTGLSKEHGSMVGAAVSSVRTADFLDKSTIDPAKMSKNPVKLFDDLAKPGENSVKPAVALTKPGENPVK
jgi:hypothetical protein